MSLALFTSMRWCALLTLLICAGCAAIVGEEKPGERTRGTRIDDDLIETRAKSNIRHSDPDLKKANIDVSAFNGIVLLTGQVPNEELRQLAEDAAKTLSKVRKIYNEIIIAGRISFIARQNDVFLSAKVGVKMMANDAVDSSHVAVVTENGIVYLMGMVSREEADAATNVAQSVAGVQKIVKVFEYTD
ncbi:MAG: BON domain-containing protein [Pseudomonadales bacterium]